MATLALDVVSVMQALMGAEEYFLGSEQTWQGDNASQVAFLNIYSRMKANLLADIPGVKGLCSANSNELNRFVGYLLFGPFEGLGIATVVDKTVEWLHSPGEITEVVTQNGLFPAFEIPSSGYQMFWVGSNVLIKFFTKSVENFWLFAQQTPTPPVSPLDMFQMAISVMTGKREVLVSSFPSVTVPMVNFQTEPKVRTFTVGIEAIDEGGEVWTIDEGRQQFRFRMSREGAKAKTGASGVPPKYYDGPLTVVINRPFYGWFTHGDCYFPIGVFYADFDSWKKPVE